MLDYKEILEELEEEEPISEIFPLFISLSSTYAFDEEFPSLKDLILKRIADMDQEAEFVLFTKALHFIIMEGVSALNDGFFREISRELIQASERIRKTFGKINSAKIKKQLK